MDRRAFLLGAAACSAVSASTAQIAGAQTSAPFATAANYSAQRDGATGGITLWVEDTGRGLDETRTPGTGLSNLRARLAAACGPQACLTLSAVAPRGVRAQIDLPPDA